MPPTLRTLLGRPALVTVPDTELLSRYAAERDDVAFAELVHRHAPAVYAACRRFLTDPASLDDAFQAVFVLLSQKAGSLTRPDKLSGWLCGAAVRIARKVRDRSARNTGTPLESVPEPAVADADPTDLKAVLDEELAGLPPTYREVVLLCDVDGLARRTAAKRLGIPESTLSNRLTRARAMLGSRLLRRGVMLGAGLSLTSVSIASVPAKLVPLTVGRIATATVPPELITLAHTGVPVMMPLQSAGLFLASLFAVGLWFIGPVAGEPVTAQPVQAKKPAAPPEPQDPEPEESKERHPATAAAYSANGKRFALALRGANEVRVYDATSWKVLHTFAMNKEMCFAVLFSTDGGTLYAAGYDGPIYTWDVKSGKAGAVLDAKAGRCSRLQLSPDGKRLASGHYDYKVDKPDDPVVSSIQLWDTATGKRERSIVADEPVMPNTLRFSPDGKAVAAGYHASHKKVPDEAGFHGVIEWDSATGKEVKRYDTPRVTPGAIPIAHAIAFTKDGKKLILGGGEAVPAQGRPGTTMLYGYLWVIDRKTGEAEKTLIGNRDDYVRSLAVSADGTRLFVPASAVAARALPPNANPNAVRPVNEFQCWDTETWELLWTATSRESHFGMELAVSPDGKRVGVGGADAFALFDAQTGEPKGGLVKTKPAR